MANDPAIYGPTGHTRLITISNASNAYSPVGQIQQYTLTHDILGNITGYTWMPVSASVPGAAAPNVAVATGVNPVETSYSLYGHIVPLSLGKVRIGGDIIAGPWIENGLATFCISFGVPADPADTRELKEIAFDSEVVWENGGFNIEPFTFRYYPGTLTQAADPIEIAHFGADAVAYRPQMLLWFENLPLASTKFKKIPYVAALIEDSTHGEVNLGSAFESLAYSPWVGYTAAEFETIGVTDGVTNGGMIIAENAEFLATIQQFGRFYRNWNILQTDKLRIVDRGATVTPDITFDKTRMMSSVVFTRGEQNSIARVLELSTIDPDADYTIVPSQAVRPREPVNVSSSVSTESAYLPVVMDTHTRQSLVTYTKYQEELARKRVNATAMMYGFEIEPGDLVGISGLGDDFEADTYKVVETTHGADYTVEFTAEAFLKCSLPLGPDPYWIYVVLLMGFEGDDGAAGGPGFTDESLKHHGTAVNSSLSEIDTAQHKFGSSSLLVKQLVIFDSSDDWSLSESNSDQFTVECWVRFNTFPAVGFYGLFCGMTSLYPSWNFSVMPSHEFRFQASTDGSNFDINVVSSGAALNSGSWYFFAVDKDASGKIRIYKDGVMMASATPVNSAIYNPHDGLSIGAGGGGGSQRLDGWIDELRITKGRARYGSDGGFPVPTNAFPRGEAF